MRLVTRLVVRDRLENTDEPRLFGLEALGEILTRVHRTPPKMVVSLESRRLASLCEKKEPVHGSGSIPVDAPRTATAEPSERLRVPTGMATFLVWLLLLVVCWPLAILALVLYPLVWLLLLPFRLVGITLEGVFRLLTAIIMLPARVLRGPSRARVA